MKKENKKKINKEEKKPNKFIELIKKKWLVNTTTTIALVAIIVAIFVAISVVMQKQNFTPIDLTEEKIFTLSKESKEQVKDIDKDINIYFVGYKDDDTTLDLARQYTKSNKKIQVEAVTATDRPDLVKKYQIETGSEGIIIECGDKFKVLSTSDLTTYDPTTYESISIAEEKLTASIKAVASGKTPKVYFLSGYSEFSINQGLSYLSMYLQNEINEVKSLDIISSGKVPDDCDTLVITTPNKDFDDLAYKAIKEYINKGGNILWMNAATVEKEDYKNVNKILAMYGVEPFSVGAVRETEAEKMAAGLPDIILPQIQYSKVTEKLQGTAGVIMVTATKINTLDSEKLEENNIQKTDLLTTSDKAYFRTNFKLQADSAQDGEEVGTFTIGALLKKTIQKADEEKNQKEIASNLIIFGESYFASDAALPISQNAQQPMITYIQNKDLVLNSIAYLSDKEEDITVRKGTGTTAYTATQEETKVILGIIIGVPVLIILIGIVVRIARRRKGQGKKEKVKKEKKNKAKKE